MSKDAYYFSHDSNSRNDEKILSLRMKLGMEGYGIYWAIIEMLRDSTDYRMQLQCERIAFELHTDNERVQSVINDFDLFEYDDIYFWSESLLRRMHIKDERSNKARESAKIRWEKANAMRTHSEGNASKGKESKGKESKVKQSKPPSLYNVKSYFRQKGYKEETGEKAFNYYESLDWKDSKGNQIKNWKNKMVSVWFKPENKLSIVAQRRLVL